MFAFAAAEPIVLRNSVRFFRLDFDPSKFRKKNGSRWDGQPELPAFAVRAVGTPSRSKSTARVKKA